MARDPLEEYRTKKYEGRELRMHQMLSLAKFKRTKCGFLFQDMRSGKTLTICALSKEIGINLLVVCPPAVRGEWESEFKTTGLKNCTIISDGKVSHKTGPLFLKKLLEKKAYDGVVLDECHVYKNTGGERSKKLKNIEKIMDSFEYRFALTGTPYLKDPAELYFLVRMIDKNHILPPSVDRFRGEWCSATKPGTKFAQYKVHKAMRKEFFEYLDDRTIYFVQEEVDYTVYKLPYGLDPSLQTAVHNCYAGIVPEGASPENTKSRWNVELSPPALYNKRRQKAYQLACGFYINKDQYGQQSFLNYSHLTDKYTTLDNHIRSCDGPVVVWYNYIWEKEFILARYGKDARQYDRRELAAYHLHKIKVILCHVRSVGAGVNLSFSYDSVFLLPLFDAINTCQAMSRLSKYEGSERENRIVFMYPQSIVEVKRREQLTGEDIVERALSGVKGVRELLHRGNK